MNVENNMTLTMPKLDTQAQATRQVLAEESAVSEAVKKMMAEDPVLMDTIEIKSILYLGIKGPINLDSSEGQSIDTFA